MFSIEKHEITVLHPLPRLNQTYQKLLVENEGLQTEHRDMKSQMNSGKQEQKRLESDLSKLKEHNQQLDITTIKLGNQCEVHEREIFFTWNVNRSSKSLEIMMRRLLVADSA